MASHNDLGKLGEDLAVEYLIKDGYEILERNWKFQKAEIDIIALKDNILAIIEVKTRSSITFGLPQDFVKPKKIRLLLAAVNAFVSEKDILYEVRLDIIAIFKDKKQFNLEHLYDSYYFFK
jgi:putative endonuclease